MCADVKLAQCTFIPVVLIKTKSTFLFFNNFEKRKENISAIINTLFKTEYLLCKCQGGKHVKMSSSKSESMNKPCQEKIDLY